MAAIPLPAFGYCQRRRRKLSGLPHRRSNTLRASISASGKSVAATPDDAHPASLILPHIKCCVIRRRRLFIHETRSICPADVGIDERWLHQHKQSIHARYTAQPNSGAALPSSPSTNPDQDFVTKAAQGNSAEVELGKIVAAKTKNPSVKQFAQMMVKDHTTALNQLQELAQSKNLNFNDDLPDDAKVAAGKTFQ